MVSSELIKLISFGPESPETMGLVASMEAKDTENKIKSENFMLSRVSQPKIVSEKVQY